MTTNARSTTSPVSTSANQIQTFQGLLPRSAKSTTNRRVSQDWWERPPTSPGSVHVAFDVDRSLRGKDSARVARDGYVDGVSPLRTGAPAIRDRHSAAPIASSRSRLGVLCAVVLAVLVGGFGIANASSSSKGEVRTYLVRPGDSFWSIARSVQSQGDLRPLVADLIEAHGSNVLQVGDRVLLPAR